ncbi:MAG: AAA family ATPase [Muribaculaceae bacterium]|nr:AAA family ATPase [Muribaculaceae bacterium]
MSMTSTKPEKAYDDALMERAQEYMERTETKQAQLAKKIDRSNTLMSQYFNHKYPGNVDDIETRLREFLQQEEEAAASKARIACQLDESYRPTSISEDVYQHIRFAQINRALVVLHGDAGAGKTKAAVQYYRNNPQSTIYIRLHPSMAGLSGVGELLGEALDIPVVSSSKQMWRSIRERLRGTNKVIIVDEAQLLKRAPLDELRILPDEDEISGIAGNGVVLIGNSELYERVKKGKVTSQAYTRIVLQHDYSTAKLTMEDVKLLFPMFSDEDKREELKLIAGICRSHHSIRTAKNIVKNAIRNEDISYNGLRAAAARTSVGRI